MPMKEVAREPGLPSGWWILPGLVGSLLVWATVIWLAVR